MQEKKPDSWLYSILKKMNQQDNDINIETKNRQVLPELSQGLTGSGYLGSKGDKAMETLSDVFGNKTAEEDSLQTDALERLTGSGFLGKKGKNLSQLLEAILKRPRP